MGGLAFLQNLLQQPPPIPNGPDPNAVAMQNMTQQPTQTPYSPEPQPPTLSWLGQTQQNQQQPAQPKADIAQGPTKLHKLLGILYGGAMGAAAGAGQRTFGQGFEQAGNLAFLGQQRKAQLAQEQAQTQGIQQETAQRAAQTKMLQTSVPVTLPNGQQVMIPQSALGGYLGKVIPSEVAAGSRESVAGTNATSREKVAETGAQSREKVANINQGNPIPLDETVANLVGLPELAGKPVGKGTLANINNMLKAKGYQYKDLGTDGLWLLDRAGNRVKLMGDSPSLTRAQARPVQVADEANPGNTKYVSGATAIATGAAGPQSASVVVPKKAGLAEVPSKIGDQKVAFNTALQHADLLESAVKALNNGDQQTLNSLKNRFKTEFGATEPMTAKTIANAYNHEITSMVAKGHMTDAEVANGGATLDVNRASVPQIMSVLGAYRNLAQSKMTQLNNQKNAAINQSQRQKPQGGSQGITVTDPRGVVHSFPNQAAANSFKAAAGIQ